MTRSGGGAGRVIAGTARGVRLESPGEGTRPLSDRVKQTLFAILEPGIRGATFLDLYAGSGAGGIEALSRGAAGAIFVERAAGAAATIRANLERAHVAGPDARVVTADVVAWLRSPSGLAPGSVGAVLVDPPYDQPALLLAALGALGVPGGAPAPGSIVVAKHFWRDEPPPRVGLLASERTRKFGDTTLTFYRVAESTEVPT